MAVCVCRREVFGSSWRIYTSQYRGMVIHPQTRKKKSQAHLPKVDKAVFPRIFMK